MREKKNTSWTDLNAKILNDEWITDDAFKNNTVDSGISDI